MKVKGTSVCPTLSIDITSISIFLSKMLLSHWEPLGVSESCWTGIPGWSNPGVDWTNALAFRCTWEHLGMLPTRLGVPTTSLGAPESADDKPGSTGD
jgi:hypothetical protein